eukprot:scaffold4174_cov150-Skeletonema_menzelii.AAC.9
MHVGRVELDPAAARQYIGLKCAVAWHTFNLRANKFAIIIGSSQLNSRQPIYGSGIRRTPNAPNPNGQWQWPTPNTRSSQR